MLQPSPITLNASPPGSPPDEAASRRIRPATNSPRIPLKKISNEGTARPGRERPPPTPPPPGALGSGAAEQGSAMSAGKARLPPGEQLPVACRWLLWFLIICQPCFWLAPCLGQTLQASGSPHRTASPNGLSELPHLREGNVDSAPGGMAAPRIALPWMGPAVPTAFPARGPHRRLSNDARAKTSRGDERAWQLQTGAIWKIPVENR